MGTTISDEAGVPRLDRLDMSQHLDKVAYSQRKKAVQKTFV